MKPMLLEFIVPVQQAHVQQTPASNNEGPTLGLKAENGHPSSKGFDNKSKGEREAVDHNKLGNSR